MAGFSTRTALIDAITSKGQFREVQFRKANAMGAAGTAGAWQHYFTSTGNPPAISFSGTAGVATQLSNTTSGALLPLDEGNVSTMKRYLLNAQFSMTVANAAPGIVIIADLLLYYPNCNSSSGGATTLDNTATLPRYTSGDGVRAIAAQRAAFGGTVNSVTFTMTDSNNASQTTGVYTATANKATQLMRAGISTGAPPFFEIPGGASGLKKIDSYSLGGSTNTGNIDIVLMKPLAMVPIVNQFIPSETDFVTQFASLPQIEDGACIGLLVLPGGNLSNGAVLSGRLTYGWN